jgi:lactate dehydrogenase-like 2-hydroxyacid dehydrogenase
VARKAFGLGMTLSYNSRNINPNLASLGALMIDKRELFKNSRIISFHTPAHTSWLTRDLLELLPKNALLINSCFGKISQNQDLEFFLEQRTDVTLVMDSIAATSYPELKQRARIDSNSAYDTPNSAKRLINKFFANIEIFNEQKAK